MVFKQSFRVHWVDTDVAGVMHFSNFFRYFEACEEEFYRSISLPLTELLERFGIMLPRVEAHCEYKAACRFNETIEVAMRIEEVAEKTITYAFQVTRQSDGRISANGFVKCIAVSKDWKVVPLPVGVAKKLHAISES
jgi:YbgC/YbaW family acyl-CoA thioester hydrolase